MQELDYYDFREESRFNTDRLSRFECSADLSADDSMAVALLTQFLHCGADVKQADEMVSFCLLFARCLVMDTSTMVCASESLKSLNALPQDYDEK